MSTPGRAAARRAQRERRVAVEMPHTRRKEKQVAKHTRRGPFRDTNGDSVLWHTTKEAPWRRKSRVRAHNRVARAARKANR